MLDDLDPMFLAMLRFSFTVSFPPFAMTLALFVLQWLARLATVAVIVSILRFWVGH